MYMKTARSLPKSWSGPQARYRWGVHRVIWHMHMAYGIRTWLQWPQVREHYYPEVHRLLKRVAGVTRAEIFDHTLRGVDPLQRLSGQENR